MRLPGLRTCSLRLRPLGVIICDTGPLVAAALSTDADHRPCVELFTALHQAGRELLIPAPVVAEVGYLLAREAGPRVESLFLRSLADGDFTTVDLTAADFARMADLVCHVWQPSARNHRRISGGGRRAAEGV
jgi:predicted nucleic acid-binding protein